MATVQEILHDVVTNEHSLVKALFILFNKQEVTEKARRESLYQNNVGFRWSHSKRMTDISLNLIFSNTLDPNDKRWLLEETDGHKHRILTYWKQIVTNW